MEQRDLLNLESLMIAIAVGPGRAWSRNFIIAGAWAAQTYQLGAAITHIEAHRSKAAYEQARGALEGLLVSFRVCRGADAPELARSGLDWWLFGLCPSCMGTGLTHEQQICPSCNGAMRVKGTEIDRRCGLMIEAACDAYDAGIGRMMRGWEEEPTLPVRTRHYFISSAPAGTWTPAADGSE